MSKMSELSQTLDDLIRCGEDLIRVAGEIKEIFSGDAEAEKEKAPEAEPVKAAAEAEGKKKKGNGKQAEPAKEKEIAFTDVRALLAEKSRAGHTSEVKALLLKYGANKLSEIKPEDYAALMAEAEVLSDE